MKFNNELSDEITSLYQTMCFNISTNDCVQDFLMNLRNTVDEKLLDKYSKIYKCSKNEAYLNYIFEYTDIDFYSMKLDNFKKIIQSECPIVELGDRFLKDNPYYKNVKVDNVKIGKYELSNEHYESYETVIYDEPQIDRKRHYLETFKIGYYKERTPYLTLLHKNTTWMSITPYEINTMQKDIDTVSGNVLICGLGLGYFPYMISLKKDVKKIVIIEKDKFIIELFNQNLKSYFPNIEIVKGDCFEESVDLLRQEHFDYVYFDIYHSVDDGIVPYLMMKNIETKFPDTKFLYWIDLSFKNMIRRCLISALYELLNNITPDEEDYDDENFFLQIIDYCRDYISKIKINTKEELYDLLSDESINKICLEYSSIFN